MAIKGSPSMAQKPTGAEFRNPTLFNRNSETENAPDYRVHAGDEDGPEVGAGWSRTGEKAGEYVSLQIDDPAFTQPIRANLFQSGNDRSAFHLLWTRPSKRENRS